MRMGAAVIALALAIRLIFILAVGRTTIRDLELTPEGYAHGLMERGRLEWDVSVPPAYAAMLDVPAGTRLVYRATHMPLYPALLAASYGMFGHQYRPIKLLQALLDSLTCGLVMWLGARTFGRPAGWIAGGLAALNWSQIARAETLYAGTVYTFLLALSVALWANQRLAAAGVGLGLAYLTRPEAFLLMGLMALLALRPPRALGVGRRLAGLLVPTCLAAILWTTRNALVIGAPIPTAYQGQALLANNHPGTRGIREISGIHMLSPAYRGIPEARRDLAYGRRAFAYLRSLSVPDLMRHERRKVAAWLAPSTPGAWNPTAWLILPLALLGLVVLRPQPPAAIALHAVWLSALIITLVFSGDHRYREPMEPFLAVYAGGAAVWIAQRIRT